MFINTKYILLATLFILAGSLSAQNLTGEWTLVARKGKNPCDRDMRMIFEPKNGAVTVLHGGRMGNCPETVENFTSWEVGKETVETRSGDKKVKLITLVNPEDPDYPVTMVLEEFVGDFMKVRAEVVMDDTTGPKSLIFRKVE